MTCSRWPMPSAKPHGHQRFLTNPIRTKCGARGICVFCAHRTTTHRRADSSLGDTVRTVAETGSGARLREIVKTYDVRGVVPEQFDAASARALGVAAARVLPESGEDTLVVGHDMRASAESLVTAFVDGVTSAGIDVVVIGLA